MRQLVAVLATLLLSSAATADSQFPKLAAALEAGDKNIKIVCIGDSITGVYYHTGGWRAYPQMLEVAVKRAYPKAKVSVVNAGISGDWVPGGLNRLERDVLKHQPHLVTIMFGMNDLTRNPADTFKKNLVTMIERCRAKGAEVMLCTQNNVMGGRDPAKLAEFSKTILDLGAEMKVPVADCYKEYEAVRIKNEQQWWLLMSDDFHPNMDGHKLFTSVLAEVITGKRDDLKDVGPPQPAIRKTLALLKAGKAIRVLAMPPYDKLIEPALKAVDPKAKVEVTSWPVAGKALAEIEKEAKKVRDMKVDLVLVAVPAGAEAKDFRTYIRSFTWVLNWSLSFGYQEWDVIALPPSTAQEKLSETERQRDALMRQLIAAQDMNMVTRPEGDTTPAGTLLARWLQRQVQPSGPSK